MKKSWILVLVLLVLLVMGIFPAAAQDDDTDGDEPVAEATGEPTVTLDYFQGETLAISPNGEYQIRTHESGTVIWLDDVNGTIITAETAFDAMVNDTGQFALLLSDGDQGELLWGALADVAFSTVNSEEGFYTRLTTSWDGAFCTEKVDFNGNRVELEHEDTAEIECGSRFSGDIWNDAFSVYVEQYNDSPAVYEPVDEQFVLNDTVTFNADDISLNVNGTIFPIALNGDFVRHNYNSETDNLTIWTTEGVYSDQLRDFLTIDQVGFEPALVLAVTENSCMLVINEATATVLVLGFNFINCDEIDAQLGFELAMDIHPPMLETPPTMHFNMVEQTATCWIRLGRKIEILVEGQYGEYFLYQVDDFSIIESRAGYSTRYSYPNNLPGNWNGLFNQYREGGGSENLITLNGSASTPDPEVGTPYCLQD